MICRLVRNFGRRLCRTSAIFCDFVRYILLQSPQSILINLVMSQNLFFLLCFFQCFCQKCHAPRQFMPRILQFFRRNSVFFEKSLHKIFDFRQNLAPIFYVIISILQMSNVKMSHFASETLRTL